MLFRFVSFRFFSFFRLLTLFSLSIFVVRLLELFFQQVFPFYFTPDTFISFLGSHFMRDNQ